MCGCTRLAHIIYQRQLYSSIIMRARHTYILWVKEELASRIESASFAPSHLGYLLFIVFFSSLYQKNRITRERCSDIGCSIWWYSLMIGRYLLLYVDRVANFFFSSFLLLSCCVSSSRIVETIFSGYEKNKMFLTYVWK